jgi:hypothetical protein
MKCVDSVENYRILTEAEIEMKTEGNFGTLNKGISISEINFYVKSGNFNNRGNFPKVYKNKTSSTRDFPFDV